MNKLLKKHVLLLGLLTVAFFIRLYAFGEPIGDWHSWRQADTSAVTRNFYKTGFDVLHPRFDDLSNVPSGFDNPQGYRFVEFPIYNLMSAGVYSFFLGMITIEQAGRLVSILSTLSIILFLYLLVTKYLTRTAGYLAAAFYAFSPYTIYYGRTILPDTTMAAAILGGIYFFDRWVTLVTKSNMKKSAKHAPLGAVYLICATVLTSAAFLLKPYSGFFVLPMLVIAWNAWKFKALLQWRLWLFAIISVVPLIAWRLWMTQYPEGIPVNQWLLNGNGIRFRPSFFRWIGYERIIKLISGYAGTVFLLTALMQLRFTKEYLFFMSFMVSSLLYLITFATGNVQHDYYQILIMPNIAMFMGVGAYGLLNFMKKFHSYVGYIVILILVSISFYFSWKQVKDYFNINNRQMIAVGKMVDQSVPIDAQVIALYQGDTSFLYQTNRQGWASFQNPLPEMITKGADYLVQLGPTDYDLVLYQRDYEVVASGSGYVLVKLHE